jgi:hypothetical protein
MRQSCHSDELHVAGEVSYLSRRDKDTDEIPPDSG